MDANRFDMVFTDALTSKMNGIDHAHRVREEHDDLPVLLASGYRHGLAQNVTCEIEFLQKPYSV